MPEKSLGAALPIEKDDKHGNDEEGRRSELGRRRMGGRLTLGRDCLHRTMSGVSELMAGLILRHSCEVSTGNALVVSYRNVWDEIEGGRVVVQLLVSR